MCPKSSFIFRSVAVGYEKVEARRFFKKNDLGDGQPGLQDLRFPDDMLSLLTSSAESVSLLHDLVTVLSQVGFILNANEMSTAFTLAFWGKDCYFGT